MTNEEAIKILNVAKLMTEGISDLSEACKMAIRSLKAWEEVREELSQLTSCSGHKDHENNCGGCAGCVECKLEDAYYVAIDMINQHLADIEEQEKNMKGGVE